MHLPRVLPVLALTLLSSACSGESEPDSARSDSQPIASEAESPICKLLTTRQLGAALGTPVMEGHTAGPLGSGCSWEIKGTDRSVMLQIVPREYWEDGTRQPGGEPIDGIGEKAFVGPWLDDFRAGALTVNGAVYVISPSKAASTALLRDVATRVPPQ